MTGGGDSEHYRELDKEFISRMSGSGELLVVPVANDPEDYDDVEERIEDEYGKGFSKIEMCTDLSKLNSDFLNSFAAIYIDGGNTFELMEQIRKSPFNQLVRGFHEQGGTVYGDSAGAIVLGREVASAFWGQDADDNIAALQAFHAVSLLDNWSIHCHYEPDDDETAQDYVYNSGSPVLAISEKTGILIEDDKETGKVFGHSPLVVFTFTGRKVIEPREEFKLSELLG